MFWGEIQLPTGGPQCWWWLSSAHTSCSSSPLGEFILWPSLCVRLKASLQGPANISTGLLPATKLKEPQRSEPSPTWEKIFFCREILAGLCLKWWDTKNKAGYHWNAALFHDSLKVHEKGWETNFAIFSPSFQSLGGTRSTLKACDQNAAVAIQKSVPASTHFLNIPPLPFPKGATSVTPFACPLVKPIVYFFWHYLCWLLSVLYAKGLDKTICAQRGDLTALSLLQFVPLHIVI